jgi:twitching motility protein PilT
MDDTRLGSILLESRVISEAQLEKCLEVQALTGNARPIGQILIEQGLLDRATLDRVVQLQQARATPTQAPSPQGAIPEGMSLVEAAFHAGARELAVSEGRPIMMRSGTGWQALTAEPVRSPEVWDFVRNEMGVKVLEELADRRFVVRDLQRPGLCRGRLVAMRHSDGVAVMAELRPVAQPSLDELGVPPVMKEALAAQRGLVLFVGERGEGRSDVMGAALAEMALQEGRYLVALDDAFAAPAPQGGAVVTRRCVGEHVADLASGLRMALREDPDAVLVGSLDEPVAFDLAVRAAVGGRLVVGWMDAADSVACLQRILNYYPDFDVARIRQSLATVLRAVCVRLEAPARTGDGRHAVTELLVVDDAVRDVLRGGDLQSLRLLLRSEGGGSGHALDQSLCELALAGKVRAEDAFALGEDKAWLLDRLRSLRLEGAEQ